MLLLRTSIPNNVGCLCNKPSARQSQVNSVATNPNANKALMWLLPERVKAIPQAPHLGLSLTHRAKHHAILASDASISRLRRAAHRKAVVIIDSDGSRSN